VEVLTLLIFVGAVWLLAGVAFFAWNLLMTNHEHTERLAMLPLEDNWTDSTLPRKEAEESKLT
jgi:hypothetical protein